MRIGSRVRALASVFGALMIWSLTGAQALADVSAKIASVERDGAATKEGCGRS